MTKLSWDAAGTRVFEAGVDRGVLYVPGLPSGVPWMGLVSVEENPDGGEAKDYFIDGIKYLQLAAKEDFKATITAFTYPDEFNVCDGTAKVRAGLYLTQQRRMPFNLSYRTKIGNDIQGVDHGYKIHLVYNALVQPAAKSYGSLADNPDASNFAWSISTKPAAMSGYQHSAHIVIDSRDMHPLTLAAVEDILYGTDMSYARVPTLEELIEIFDTPVEFSIVDNEDGTFTISGPDDVVFELLGDPTQFTIDWPTVTPAGDDQYSITD